MGSLVFKGEIQNYINFDYKKDTQKKLLYFVHRRRMELSKSGYLLENEVLQNFSWIFDMENGL